MSQIKQFAESQNIIETGNAQQDLNYISSKRLGMCDRVGVGGRKLKS